MVRAEPAPEQPPVLVPTYCILEVEPMMGGATLSCMEISVCLQYIVIAVLSLLFTTIVGSVRLHEGKKLQ